MPHKTLVKLSRPYLSTAAEDFLGRQSGFTGEAGARRRLDGFHFVWSVCRTLSWGVHVFSPAMLFYQRSLLVTTHLDPMPLAGACILISSKLDNSAKKVVELAAALIRCSIPGIPVPPYVSRPESLAQKILECERLVLEVVCFDFRAEDPHIYVIKIAKTLGLSEAVAASAWLISTDAFATSCILRHPAQTIALGAVLIAARLASTKVTADAAELGSDAAAVADVLHELATFYLRQPEHTRLSSRGPVDLPVLEALAGKFKASEDQGNLRYLDMVDRSLSSTDTVRYVLNTEREHLKNEPVT